MPPHPGAALLRLRAGVSGWLVSGVLACALALPAAGFAVETAPAAADPGRMSSARNRKAAPKRVSPAADVRTFRGADASASAPMAGLASVVLTDPRPESETPIQFGPSPEDTPADKRHLDAVGGRATIEVSIPDALTKFSNVVAVDNINLAHAVLGAYGFSRDIRMAEARKDQALSQSRQARGLLLPSLTLRDSSGRETSSPGSVTDAATGSAKVRDEHLRKDKIVTFKQPLLDAPSLLDWGRRDSIVDSRQGSLISAQGDTYVAAVQSYLNIITTRLLSELYQEYEQQLDVLLNYVSKRAEAGASSQSDMERVRARSLAAKSQRIEQDAAYSAAIVEFIRITNLAPRNLVLPHREEVSRGLPESYDKGIDAALEANPEMRVLKAELDAAEKDIQAARARHLPRVDFEVSDSKITNAGGPTGLQHDQRAMVVMTWNVLNGSVDYYNLREKQDKRVESFYKLDDQQRRLRQGLSAQYATLDAAKARINAGYREWSATYFAARSMSQRMLSGNQSLLDLLDALDRVQQARARLISLHASEILSVAQIARLVGNFPDAETLAEKTARLGAGNQSGF